MLSILCFNYRVNDTNDRGSRLPYRCAKSILVNWTGCPHLCAWAATESRSHIEVDIIRPQNY